MLKLKSYTPYFAYYVNENKTRIAPCNVSIDHIGNNYRYNNSNYLSGNCNLLSSIDKHITALLLKY